MFAEQLTLTVEKADYLHALIGMKDEAHPGLLSCKCCRHVATCRQRHNVSLQFWPDGSVSPIQN
jgi:hypothetical protein